MWIYMFLIFIILHLLCIHSLMLFEIVLPGSLDKLRCLFLSCFEEKKC